MMVQCNSLPYSNLERGGAQVRLNTTGQWMDHEWKHQDELTLCTVCSGKRVLASSFETPGCTITSSPTFQFTGVVIRCLSPSCSESMTLMIL
jgi:hypothetical protein